MTGGRPIASLHRGDSQVAWALSPVSATPFPGEPAPAEDRVGYRFANSFVEAGDLPCRVATRRDVASRTVALRRDWPVEGFVLPGAGRRVVFAQFRYTPTRLARWCRCEMRPARDGRYTFRLGTRGGVHIWVDGVLAARFEPFTRTRDGSTTVVLPLSAGGSEVVVLMEDMAERDTDWYFELTLEDDAAIDVHLPGGPDVTHLETLRRLAAEVRPECEVLSAGPLVLAFDSPASCPVSVDVRIEPASHDHEMILVRTVVVPPGAARVTLCDAAELPDGYLRIGLTLRVGDCRVGRRIACAVLHRIDPPRHGGDLTARKRTALVHAAGHGELRMGTALAMLAAGRAPDARFRRILEQTLDAIEARQDCSDFEIVPLLWVLARHADRLPVDLHDRARAAVLGYRYWVDEPGNDVMWFWSENHTLCFHVAQLLAGQLYPDAPFATSGRSGSEQARLAAVRLGHWFDAVERDGLAEWNAAAYYPIDLIGLLALIEFAPDGLAARARALTDRIFTMVALHTLSGVPAGSMGRAYDKELRAGPLTELAPIVAVAFGTGWLNRGVAALPMLAAGGYVPPAEAARLAFPTAGEAIEAHYVQGHGRAAELALYKTASVQLSTNAAARAGAAGYQQHLVDLLFAAHPFARAWINHPGEDDPWGSGRPSYWAGNGVLPRMAQHGDCALLLYDLGEAPRVGFTHAYVSPAGIEARHVGHAVVMASGDGVAAFVATTPLTAVAGGPGAGREYRAAGRHVGWAVIVDHAVPLDAFAQRIAETRLRLDPAGRLLVLEVPGRPGLALGWAEGLRVAGMPRPFPNHRTEPLITARAR